MEKRNQGLTLLELLVVVAVISLLFALAVPVWSRSCRDARKRDCIGNFRQLGTYVVMYVTKYGSDRFYPPAAGEGFWNTLRNIPSPTKAMSRGNDGLFICKVLGTRPSPTALDYREPGPGMPFGRLADGLTQPQWPIGCDRPTNHDPSGQDDINVLYFSGSVSAATFGSPEWTTAMNYTQ